LGKKECSPRKRKRIEKSLGRTRGSRTVGAKRRIGKVEGQKRK